MAVSVSKIFQLVRVLKDEMDDTRNQQEQTRPPLSEDCCHWNVIMNFDRKLLMFFRNLLPPCSGQAVEAIDPH
jgi:hypothetical protein